MRFLDLEQNTPEWLLSRVEILGGSEIPVIVDGVSPYPNGKNRELFIKSKAAGRFMLRKLRAAGRTDEEIINSAEMEDKLISTNKNSLFALGHWVEDWQRPLACIKIGKTFEPKVARHDTCDYLSVSFDGLAEDNDVWECKYTKYAYVMDAMTDGKVPRHFYLQVMFQLLISGGKTGFLTMVALQRDRRTVKQDITISIPRDEKVINLIYQKCKEANEAIEKEVRELDTRYKQKTAQA